MCKSMHKIIYYENVLEFKENTMERLNLNELNNWQLCRTCLVDTCEDDVNMEKMSVIDVMQGTFLNIKEMLDKATNFEISTTDELPLQLCKECIGKITSLYYFSIQVRRADKVLIRLANKLKGCQNNLEETCEAENTIESEESNVSMKFEDVYEYPQDVENLEDMANTSADENETFEKLADIKDSSEYFEKISIIETDKEAELLKDEKELILGIEEDLFLEDEENIADLKSNTDNEESQLDKDLFKDLGTSSSDNGETSIVTQNKVTILRKRVGNFKTMSGYKHKQPRVTSPLLNDFDCAICQDSFGRQRDLVHHVRKSHPNSKAYKCRVCGNLFSHIQSLSRHMNSHKDAVILIECEFCSKSFIRVDDLKRHLRMHTGERPYVCYFCEKSYQQHFDLKNHEEKHLYGDTNFRPSKYECAECKLNYTSRTGLYLHKKKHHREASDDNELSLDSSMCEKSVDILTELDNNFRTELIECTENGENFTSHIGLNINKKSLIKARARQERNVKKKMKMK